jgi:sec-independent protein translocase protein TatB
MGGLGPGIGGFEILVIGLVALLVVGPRDLPVLMRRVGQAMARARSMANEFRASFDEMARQSELDELRREVEALRTGQGMYKLGADADAAFRDIKADLERPLDAPPPPPVIQPRDEWPDAPSASPEPAAAPEATSAPKSAAAKKSPARTSSVATKKPASRKPAAGKSAPAKAGPARRKAAKP